MIVLTSRFHDKSEVKIWINIYLKDVKGKEKSKTYIHNIEL